MSTEWQQYRGIRLCPSLQEDGTERAVTILRRYFEQFAEGDFHFTGGAWDSFDPSGTRDASADVFTADDVLSCTLLSTPIGAPAALKLLDPGEDNEFSALLRAIPTDVDFVDETWPNSKGFEAANELFERLRTLPGIGLTRTTKLLARKRPHLVPIVDSVIRHHVFDDGKQHWAPLREALRAEDLTLWRRLEHVHQEARLPQHVSTLRVFDVLSWMDGAGYADRIMSGGRIVPPGDGTQDDPDVTAR